jgi:hypothetical protein
MQGLSIHPSGQVFFAGSHLVMRFRKLAERGYSRVSLERTSQMQAILKMDANHLLLFIEAGTSMLDLLSLVMLLKRPQLL